MATTHNPSTRGRSNRRKGQEGERELAKALGDILGIDLRRRVRNHEGDSDITGLNGFSVEVKKQATPCMKSWWEQTVTQAAKTGDIPVLFYRLPRRDFRAVISVYPFLGEYGYSTFIEYEQTLDMSLEAFASVYRFIIEMKQTVAMEEKKYREVN